MVENTMNVKIYILKSIVLSEIDMLLSEIAMSVSIYYFTFAVKIHW